MTLPLYKVDLAHWQIQLLSTFLFLVFVKEQQVSLPRLYLVHTSARLLPPSHSLPLSPFVSHLSGCHDFV